jgi:hypothetical protein
MMTTTIAVVLLRLLEAGVLVATVNDHLAADHLHLLMTTMDVMDMDAAALPEAIIHLLAVMTILTMRVHLHLLAAAIRTPMPVELIPTHAPAVHLVAMAMVEGTTEAMTGDIRNSPIYQPMICPARSYLKTSCNDWIHPTRLNVPRNTCTGSGTRLIAAIETLAHMDLTYAWE